MRIITGRVVDGKVVVGGGQLEEGSLVTVVVPDSEPFVASAAEEAQLMESLAQCEHGETITADQLFARLRKPV